MFQDHKGPVTSLQFNWDDTAIASGSETGDIILHNVVTGIGYSPMTQRRAQVRLSLASKQHNSVHYSETCLGRPLLSGTTCLEGPHIPSRIFHVVMQMTCHLGDLSLECMLLAQCFSQVLLYIILCAWWLADFLNQDRVYKLYRWDSVSEFRCR